MPGRQRPGGQRAESWWAATHRRSRCVRLGGPGSTPPSPLPDQGGDLMGGFFKTCSIRFKFSKILVSEEGLAWVFAGASGRTGVGWGLRRIYLLRLQSLAPTPTHISGCDPASGGYLAGHCLRPQQDNQTLQVPTLSIPSTSRDPASSTDVPPAGFFFRVSRNLALLQGRDAKPTYPAGPHPTSQSPDYASTTALTRVHPPCHLYLVSVVCGALGAIPAFLRGEKVYLYRPGSQELSAD